MSRSGLNRCAIQWRGWHPCLAIPQLIAWEKIGQQSCAVRYGCYEPETPDSEDCNRFMSEAAMTVN